MFDLFLETDILFNIFCHFSLCFRRCAFNSRAFFFFFFFSNQCKHVRSVEIEMSDFSKKKIGELRWPIRRFGHFRSVVGADRSWGQTHFDVLSLKLRQAASFPQICGRPLHPVITVLPLIGSSLTITSDCCVDAAADNSETIFTRYRNCVSLQRSAVSLPANKNITSIPWTKWTMSPCVFDTKTAKDWSRDVKVRKHRYTIEYTNFHSCIL